MERLEHHSSEPDVPLGNHWEDEVNPKILGPLDKEAVELMRRCHLSIGDFENPTHLGMEDGQSL